MSTDHPNFSDAVATRLKTLREGFGITQPTLQKHARDKYGAQWSRGTVSGFETGRGAMTVPTLIVLAASLSDLSGETLTVGDLVNTIDRIQITPRLSMRGSNLAKLLSSNPVQLNEANGVVIEPNIEEIVRNAFVSARFDPKFESAQETIDAMSSVKKWPVSLSVERASKRLGISENAFQLWSFKLWGNSLDEEISARGGHHSTPQKRGHLNRLLVKEIQEALSRQRG